MKHRFFQAELAGMSSLRMANCIASSTDRNCSGGRRCTCPGTLILVLVLWIGLLDLCVGADKGSDAKQPGTVGVSAAVDFHQDIKPIFVRHCFACHGPAKSESGLRLDLRSAAMHGGDDGPVIVKGDSARSMLIQYVTGQNESGTVMPPKDKGSPLSEQEIALLKSWIDQGAAWPNLPGGAPASKDSGGIPELERADRDPTAKHVNTESQTQNSSGSDVADGTTLTEHWAFLPVRHVRPPMLHDAWIDTPIDAFVLQQLQAHHLTPNPQAARIDLIRRVTFDLTGLPPTPEEVQQFVSDKSPDAYEHVVNRLLDSMQYGEHWGRHWLDLARYADSDGFENDSDRPNAYKYRDYVIRSFNEDKPYNQFILEQLAGDELDEVGPDRLIALGFCRNGPTISNQMNEKNRVDEVDDMVSTTVRCF